jgi:multicomponent Na+:H+ antiporter subunit G
MTLIEILTLIFATLGVGFMVLSSIGMLRMPDLYTRIHAAAKAGTVGVIGTLLALGVHSQDFLTIAKMTALIGFFLLTAPVASHMIDRAAYLTRVETTDTTVVDDLEGQYDFETGKLR